MKWDDRFHECTTKPEYIGVEYTSDWVFIHKCPENGPLRAVPVIRYCPYCGLDLHAIAKPGEHALNLIRRI